jgi:hypothetical protein
MPLDAARDGLIAVQAQLIEVLATRNAGLEARVGEMEERLARLERAVSRNSGNSSMPPSADDLPGRTAPGPRQARGGGKKRPGKQPGAPGSYLAWSKDRGTGCRCSRRGHAGAAGTWPVPKTWARWRRTSSSMPLWSPLA